MMNKLIPYLNNFVIVKCLFLKNIRVVIYLLWNGEEGIQRGEQSLLREKENRENLLMVRGKSHEPNLRIGGRAKLSDINDKAMETYRILEITHHHNGNEYYNEFVGIPDVFHAPYQDNFALPRAEEQVAKVMDNADPKGMGRVRVQMLWQEKRNDKTPWLRLVQPHAGGGKGFYFVPELGEEVLVGFEGGNAEKPYIIGTHYNGKEKSNYHTAGNDKKVIHTRSGTKIVLNDAEGSVKIEDPSGSSIYLDGKQKISFNGAVLEFNAQKIIMNASDSTQITTNDYILNALSKIYIFSNWFKQQINGFVQLWSTKTLIKGTEAIDIEAKEAKLHGTEKMVAHSDKLALVNSKETLEVKGQKKNNFSNQAADVSSSPNEEIGLAVVHFRPTEEWKGEFGFDWLRTGDNDIHLASDIAYSRIIESGYNDGVTDLTGGADGTAYAKLKTQYHTHTIIRKDASNTNTEYFVPYLSLFSKEFVDNLASSVNAPMVLPKYEAEVQILVEIEEDIDRLEFEYDNTLFTISEKKLEDKNKTPLKKGQIIKITCLKDLDSDKEIKIYAYPKKHVPISDEIEGNKNEDIQQLINRKLAGKIIVIRNDSEVRKEEKIVLVEVHTDIDKNGIIKRGTFSHMEKVNLYNSLHQFLIIPIIKNSILDISSKSDFQMGGKHIIGNLIKYKFLNESGTNMIRNNALFIDIKNCFKEVKDSHGNFVNAEYTDYFTIFNFGVSDSIANVLGAVEDIGIRNVIMFTTLYDDETTLNHEILHGLRLHHTHRDNTPIKERIRKYIFPNALHDPLNATNNIMSYNSNAFTSWRWQWNIINPNIKEK